MYFEACIFLVKVHVYTLKVVKNVCQMGRSLYIITDDHFMFHSGDKWLIFDIKMSLDTNGLANNAVLNRLQIIVPLSLSVISVFKLLSLYFTMCSLHTFNLFGVDSMPLIWLSIIGVLSPNNIVSLSEWKLLIQLGHL